MRNRTLGRELALKYLYARDAGGSENDDDFSAFADDQETSADARAFAKRLTAGVEAHREALKETVINAATNFNWREMARVDRNLLLMGAYEIAHEEDIHPTVTINEIIELGKRYGDVSTHAFINAILDAIAGNK